MLVVKCLVSEVYRPIRTVTETRDMFKMSFVTISAFLTMNTQLLSFSHWSFMSSIKLKLWMRYMR